MNTDTGGDPIQAGDVEVVTSGEATAKEPALTEAVPPKEDGTPPKEEVSPSETEPKGDEFRKKADDAHRQVIDLIEDKFQLLKDGRLSDAELRTWFKEREEFASTANRSKRVKEQYRALMDRSPDVRRGETKVEVPKESEIVEDADEKPAAPVGDRPLTASDLQKMLDEREERILERTLRRERESETRTFASKNGLLDEDYRALQRNAEALLKANEEWTYTEALEAAKAVVRPSKAKAMNVASAGSNQSRQEDVEEKLDLSKTTELMDIEEFTGRKRR